MDLQEVLAIEKATRKKVYQILGPEFVEKRIGRFTVRIPQYRVKFQGEKMWYIWTARGGLVQ